MSIDSTNKTERIMKNGFLALMLAGVCLIPSLSLADTPYMSVSFGGAELNNSRYTYYGSNISNAIVFKESMTYGGAIGLRGDGYRLEAAYGHQQNKADKISKQLIPNSYTFIPVQGTGDDKVSINSYMVNGYLDMDQDASIDPYVMTGIGLVNIKASGPTIYSASSTVFAWQFGLGASIKVSEHLLIDLGFRYLKPSNYTSTELENLKVSNSSKNLMTGLQYVF